MLKRGDKDYRESYINIKGNYHYFDKAEVIVPNGNRYLHTTYEAYGDGAHLMQTKFTIVDSISDKVIEEYNGTFAYHNMQLEDFFNKAVKIIFTRNGEENIILPLAM